MSMSVLNRNEPYSYRYLLVLCAVLCFSSCNIGSQNKEWILGVWKIKSSTHPLNEFDKCYLGEEIQFFKTGVYIFSSQCYAEKPFGRLSSGFYEFNSSEGDTIILYNNYHSEIFRAHLKKVNSKEMYLKYKRILSFDKNIITEDDSITMNRVNNPIYLKED